MRPFRHSSAIPNPFQVMAFLSRLGYKHACTCIPNNPAITDTTDNNYHVTNVIMHILVIIISDMSLVLYSHVVIQSTYTITNTTCTTLHIIAHSRSMYNCQ